MATRSVVDEPTLESVTAELLALKAAMAPTQKAVETAEAAFEQAKADLDDAVNQMKSLRALQNRLLDA